MTTQNGPVFTQLQAHAGPSAITGGLLNVCNQTVDNLLSIPTHNSRPGMLLGKIQSGKTKAFIGVLAIAFDNGYDHAVIFTKGTKALTRQTVSRLKRDLRLAIDQELVSVYDIMSLPPSLSPWELERKLVVVCKKEDDNMNYLAEFLTGTYPELASKRLLLIDDEADLASIGYKRGPEGVVANVIPTQMNGLRDSLTNASYLMVTATPYAVYLQPEDVVIPATQQVFQPVRPAFTELVPVHSGYVGGDFYFEQSGNPSSVASRLHVQVAPEELSNLKAAYSVDLANALTVNGISALRHAIMTFVIGGTIRRWQQTQEEKPLKRYSFLVHTEVSNASHNWQNKFVSTVIDQLRSAAASNIESLTTLVTNSYDDLVQSITLATKTPPTLADIMARVPQALNGVQTQTVNKESDVEQLLDDNGQLELRNPLNIFIGGNILDRGLTIDNVIGFYYGRNPKKSQQDTVLQHARMYGARAAEDLAVTRFYTTAAIYHRMETIHQFDLALWSAFENGGQDNGVVFLQRDLNSQITPCAPNKILLSDLTSLRPGSTLVPAGFTTNNSTSVAVAAIDGLLAGVDANPNAATYTLPLAVAQQIIDQIRISLTIDTQSEFGFDTLKAAVAYLVSINAAPGEAGQVACLVRRGRNVSKFRSNGRLQNAPAQQQEFSDVGTFRGGRPALILLRLTGSLETGWSGVPFYWPVLSVQSGIQPVVFSAQPA